MATSTAPATGFLVHRPVRAYPRPLPAIELTVAAPPAIGWTASSLAGWLQYLVPLVGSGGSVAFLFAIPGPRPAWLIALVAGAAVASVVAGLALRLVERRSARRARRRERSRYLAHLEQIAIQVNQLAAAQLAVAEHLHPDLPTLRATIDQTNRLWERRPGDADFLTARVGRGPIPLATPARLDTAGGQLVEYDPDLLQAAKDLVRRANRLPDAPVAIPLRQLPILSLTGPPARTRALARSLICQLAAFHAPDDLQIIAAHPLTARPTWDWLRWLPHSRDPTARDPTAARGQPPASLLADTQARSGDARPHLLAILDTTQAGPVADPPRGLDSTARPGRAVRDTRVEEWLERAAAGGVAAAGSAVSGVAAAGVTVVWLAATTADEPSELSMRIRVDDQGFATLLETVPSGRQVTGIRADSASIATCETIARRLAPLRLDRPLPKASRTGPIRLLDLLASQARSSGSAGDTGPAGREAQPGRSDPTGKASPDGAVGPHGDELPLRPRGELLNVPVGVGPAGQPLVLDLKEAAEGGIGPHGLVVGATGSGKSELLRTIVAGLAATHPPEQLAFVLVDFKGGAAFAPLAPLPQGAGLITNLQSDLSMVDRAMAALQGELARRQRLLHLAGNQPDLRAYTARRATDPRLEPLPYLLIVVDEFGELLAVRPEFLDIFTAIGRVGRSLGMHLLLASQRLDEGRLRGLDSHLRFRICLRTFSAAESTAVLGVPDAHHLPPAPGTALIKIDASPPVPFTAALISTDRPNPPQALPAPAPGHCGFRADLEVLVDSLVRAGPRAHQVWLPPLAGAIELDPLLRTAAPGWLRVPVGVVDRPLEQVQEPLMLDLSRSAGHLAVVGAPRTGKSTLLCTIVAALAATHPPDEVQAYAVDLGGGFLHRLGELPHVGAVCGPREAERVRHLVRELRTLVFERERRFRDLGVDSMAAWHDLRRGGLDLGGYGEVFVLIDNWGAFVRELPELEAEITELAAIGLHYGVHLVLAANRWAELRPGLRENLGGRLELRLNDPLESELGRSAAAGLPELPGRGLTQAGLQFQVALPGPAGAVLERAMPGQDGAAAPPLRLLPTLVREEELSAVDQAAAGPLSGPAGRAGSGVPAGLLLGVEEHRLDTVWLDLFEGAPHLLVLGDGGCGKSSLLRLIAKGLAALYPPEEVALLVIDLRRGLLDLTSLPNLAGHACTPATVARAVDHLHRELTERTPADSGLPPGPPNGPGSPSAPPIGAGLEGPGGSLAPPIGAGLNLTELQDAGLRLRLPVGAGLNGADPRDANPRLPPNGTQMPDRSQTTHPPSPTPGHRDADSPTGLVGAPVRARPRWVVLVDDYDLLPAAAGSPLLPLLDLLGLGRELGFHLVLTRRVAGAARAAFEPVFQRLRELGGSGLVMGGDPGEGPLLGNQRAAPLPPGRGFLVRPRRAPALVQVAYSPPPPVEAARPEGDAWVGEG